MSTGNSRATVAGKKGEARRVKREGEKGKMLNVKLLGFIVILVFGLIIVIFILFSLFDKHYTTASVRCQVNSGKNS